MASLLKGTAFITGAASGIGKHAALSFAKYGIQRLALADMNKEALATSIKSLQERYPNVEVLSLQMNVQNSAEVKYGIAETVQKFGRLDVAVNNAGIGGSGAQTHDVSEEEWIKVIDVDLHGVWRCQKEEISVMLGQEDLGPRVGRGRIINVASMYGLIAPHSYISATAYTAAKHGVIGLTKGDGNAYGPLGIRINAISPGYVETPLVAQTMSRDANAPLTQDIAKTPLRRIATMDEIGDSITYLASPLSSFMQSSTLVVDGGFTIA
ncbi:3-oxoacyl-reductase [Xylariales sp. PMI_506]|nr:3-oxoacyl-reductase [Xylariales sp. PMI_506]